MRRLLISLGVVIAAAVAALLTGYLWLDQSPVDDAPTSLHVCGRTYVKPAPQGVYRRDIEAQGLSVQGHVWTWQGKRAVWGTDASGSCGPGVYLEVGGNDFRGYVLSGTR